MRWFSENSSNARARRERRQAWQGAPSVCEPLERRQLMAAEVLTYHNDNQRTGDNLSEVTLTPANVNAATFGKVGQVAVDGAVYAQPLYKANLLIPGQGVHNVVFVATEHNSVYAFDADNFALLWHDSLINPLAPASTLSTSDVQNNAISPEIGITGTPVIDPSNNTIYVVDTAKTTAGKAPVVFDQLHALDLATGAEKFGGPVTISATVPGRGDGSVRGRVSFNARWELQRAGLLLLDGVVYISWASYGDIGPYHGWVIGYTANGLRQVSAFNDTPNGEEGGIWMGGGGPAADTNHNIFLAIGNGTFSANKKGGRDFGDSVVKLSARNALAVADYFSPFNQAFLSANDLDLGSGGVLLLPNQPGPHPHLLVTTGKNGTLYLIDRDNMSRFNRKTDAIVQEIPHAVATAYSTPAYFNGTIYDVGAAYLGNPDTGAQVLTAWPLINGRVTSTPTFGSYPYGYPGATPSVSASGTTNGIVWTLDNGGSGGSLPAILRAYNANNINVELYDSAQAGVRDLAGPAVKFTVPTVVNGKVYVGGQGTLTIYGLLPPL
jgi:hypothetical protein